VQQIAAAFQSSRFPVSGSQLSSAQKLGTVNWKLREIGKQACTLRKGKNSPTGKIFSDTSAVLIPSQFRKSAVFAGAMDIAKSL